MQLEKAQVNSQLG